MRPVVIASACRTPIGSFGGSLSSLRATELGSIVVRESIKRARLAPENINEVILGCVLPAGLGQAPARQAALGAGLPDSVEALTVNKMCGSGLKAVMLAAQAISCGDADIIVAGGMESMSNAPYILEKARTGYRMGHGQIIDSMIKDGLWDVYNDVHMGNAAELCARDCAVPREAQDEFAVESYRRAQDAQRTGKFSDEIVPVSVPKKKGEMALVGEDEEPQHVDFQKIPALKPAFQVGGTVTAANASKINDGASAVVVMAEEVAGKMGIKPLGRIVTYSSIAKKPVWFTTAPVDGIQKVLLRARMTKDDIDLFEINEAFAVVTLAAEKMLGLDPAKVNVNGGAVALGHPIGASGARILTTLLYALRQRDKTRGLAAICIGGGEASTMIVDAVL